MSQPEKNEHGQAGHPSGSEFEQTPENVARVIDSKAIFAGRREVWICHGDEMYRLRLTSSGKLYMSK